MTTWYVIYSLGEADVATWELRARTHGVQVRHLSAREGHDFDSAARPGSRPDAAHPNATGRRSPRSATPVCTAPRTPPSRRTARSAGVWIAETRTGPSRLPRSWGQLTPAPRVIPPSGSQFENDSDDSGHPIAETGVCYRLNEDDLRRRAVALAGSPDDIEELTHLVDGLYEERLNEAQA